MLQQNSHNNLFLLCFRGNGNRLKIRGDAFSKTKSFQDAVKFYFRKVNNDQEEDKSRKDRLSKIITLYDRKECDALKK